MSNRVGIPAFLALVLLLAPQATTAVPNCCKILCTGNGDAHLVQVESDKPCPSKILEPVGCVLVGEHDVAKEKACPMGVIEPSDAKVWPRATP